MRLFIAVFLLACGGGEDVPEGPVPGADQPSPAHVPMAGEGEISARLSGVVEVPNFTGGKIQLDAVAQVDGQTHVVANERYDEPGEFRLVVRGEHESIDIVVYLIAGDGGPAAGDVRFEYPGNPISLDGSDDGVLEIADMTITVLPEEGVVGGGPVGPDAKLEEGQAAPPEDGSEAPPPPPMPPAEGEPPTPEGDVAPAPAAEDG